jgi:hypothetical protein
MQYDLTRPNSGRMIDYWLGGTHNFEVDRQLADQLEKQFPLMRRFCQDDRGLTGRCVNYFYQQGLRTILDFGSSLPTCGNTPLVARSLDPQIKVVCSDLDPITVVYGKEILADVPNTLYVACDAATPRALLDAPEVRAFIGDERRVGVVFNALPHLMTDEQIRAAWHTLYDWVAPGSYLSVSAPCAGWLDYPETARIIEMYKHSGLLVNLRTREQYAALVPPWRLTAEGIADNQAWGLPPQSDQRVFFYSMMLFK